MENLHNFNNLENIEFEIPERVERVLIRKFGANYKILNSINLSHREGNSAFASKLTIYGLVPGIRTYIVILQSNNEVLFLEEPPS